MPRKQSLFFTYDGKSSDAFGIVQVQKGSGLFEEQFMPSRSIVEETIPGRDEPYFFGTTSVPIEDDMVIYTDKNLTDTEIEAITDFLYKPYYRPLVFSDNPEKIYYAMFIGDAKLIHNGAKQGYFTIRFRCNSPYSYSPVYARNIYSDSNTEYKDIILENSGIFEVDTTIKIQKIGNGDVSIINTSNQGKEVKLTGLIDTQYVEIDGENKDVSTNLDAENIYSKFNLNYLKLLRGVNRLKIKGKANIEISYYYRYYS